LVSFIFHIFGTPIRDCQEDTPVASSSSSELTPTTTKYKKKKILHLSGFQPTGNAVKVKGVVAHSPRHGALFARCRSLIGLTLDTQLHNVISVLRPSDSANNSTNHTTNLAKQP
jgi:hypothetical protein